MFENIEVKKIVESVLVGSAAGLMIYTLIGLEKKQRNLELRILGIEKDIDQLYGEELI